MGKYTATKERTGFGVPHGRTDKAAIDELIELSKDDDPKVRAVAAMNLCPCHVQSEVSVVWDRIVELMDDPDARVRDKALHALADGSPRHMADRIAEILELHRNDADRAIRRKINKVLAHYYRTGKVNVL